MDIPEMKNGGEDTEHNILLVLRKRQKVQRVARLLEGLIVVHAINHSIPSLIRVAKLLGRFWDKTTNRRLLLCIFSEIKKEKP